MANSYGLQKFGEAVDELALAKGDINKRLVTAFVSLVPIVADEDLPADMRQRYNRLKARVTAVEPTGKEGSLRATISRMDDEEAQQCAREIVAMHSELQARVED
jgi:hypothetical protein